MVVFGSETERAWAAGFYDGEGSCYVKHIKSRGKDLSKRYHVLEMAIAQCADGERILKRFRAAVGGFGRVRLQSKAGRRKNWSEVWQFVMSMSDEFQTVMGVLWPFLSHPKKAQFTRVMKEYKAHFDAMTPEGQMRSKLFSKGHVTYRAKRKALAAQTA